jgi:hypothetical protein
MPTPPSATKSATEAMIVAGDGRYPLSFISSSLAIAVDAAPETVRKPHSFLTGG